MFLKNLTKAILATFILYTLAFMAVVWAPWPPSPTFTTVMDDWKRDQEIGFSIYQSALMAFVLAMNWKWPYSGGEFLSTLVLIFAPMGILAYYGAEKLFSLPWSAMQLIATAALFWLIFNMKNKKDHQSEQATPA